MGVARPPKPQRDWRWLESAGEWVRGRDPRLAITPKERILVREVYRFLEDKTNRPASLRQAFYNLVSRQIIENTDGQYEMLGAALVKARVQGLIPWAWMEDRTRKPRTAQQWESLPEFLELIRGAYRRNVWENQQSYFEVNVEKDALSAIFESELRPYGVTLNVGRGYDSVDSIYGMASRIQQKLSLGVPCTILYFGDFDPSGTNMLESLEGRFGELGVGGVRFERCALNLEHIRQFNLPIDSSKKTDSRRDAHVAMYGDVSVELDALPPRILRQTIVEAVESNMDLDALQYTFDHQDRERGIVSDMISMLGDYE